MENDYHETVRRALANCEDCNLITDAEAELVRKALKSEAAGKPVSPAQQRSIELVINLNRAFNWS